MLKSFSIWPSFGSSIQVCTISKNSFVRFIHNFHGYKHRNRQKQKKWRKKIAKNKIGEEKKKTADKIIIGNFQLQRVWMKSGCIRTSYRSDILLNCLWNENKILEQKNVYCLKSNKFLLEIHHLHRFYISFDSNVIEIEIVKMCFFFSGKYVRTVLTLQQNLFIETLCFATAETENTHPFCSTHTTSEFPRFFFFLVLSLMLQICLDSVIVTV